MLDHSKHGSELHRKFMSMDFYSHMTIAEIEQLYEFNQGVLMGHGPRWAENIPVNEEMRKQADIPLITEAFGDWEGERVIICGAGPTLHDNIKKIRKLSRNGWRIMAVDRALRPLKKAGIQPDFVVTVDCQETVYDFLEPLTGEKVLCSYVTNPSVVALSGTRGKPYLYLHAAPLDHLVLEAYEVGDVPQEACCLKAGSVVSYTAAELAVRLGCNMVAMIGNELGWPPDVEVEGMYKDDTVTILDHDSNPVWYTIPNFYNAAYMFQHFEQNYHGVQFMDWSGGIAVMTKADINWFTECKNAKTKRSRKKEKRNRKTLKHRYH